VRKRGATKNKAMDKTREMVTIAQTKPPEIFSSSSSSDTLAE
jgi:hypothetical protein